jgi:hypothetical protein
MLQLRQQFAQTGQCGLDQAFTTQEIDQMRIPANVTAIDIASIHPWLPCDCSSTKHFPQIRPAKKLSAKPLLPERRQGKRSAA